MALTFHAVKKTRESGSSSKGSLPCALAQQPGYLNALTRSSHVVASCDLVSCQAVKRLATQAETTQVEPVGELTSEAKYLPQPAEGGLSSSLAAAMPAGGATARKRSASSKDRAARPRQRTRTRQASHAGSHTMDFPILECPHIRGKAIQLTEKARAAVLNPLKWLCGTLISNVFAVQ